MKSKVFIDSDIFLDVALERKEFVAHSKGVLALAENKLIEGLTSSLIICNIFYIIRKLGDAPLAKRYISNLLKNITVLSVDYIDIENSIKSSFTDFEDGVQYSVSQRNQCDYIVTRNTDDYKKSEIPILVPFELIAICKEQISDK